MSYRCLILSGGEYDRADEIFSGFDLTIACDRGYDYAHRLGIRPDLVIGDFDSCEENSVNVSGIPVLKLPVMKDDTDTLSAVKYALNRHADDITICCAFGGRFDHSIANLQTAAYAAVRGAKMTLLGKDTVAYVLSDGKITIRKKEGFSLSLFSLSDKCENISANGVLYPLKNATLTNALTNGCPLGVSNEWTSAQAEISVGSGLLLIILSALKPL